MQCEPTTHMFESCILAAARTLLLTAMVLALSTATATATSSSATPMGTPTVARDLHGNLHINSSSNATTFVNGVDVVGRLARLGRLLDGLESRSAAPTARPTTSPTANPTTAPSASPTAAPSTAPTSTPTPAPTVGFEWAAGGDAGRSWSASATSSYSACSLYDLCNANYAIDGTATAGGTTGKVFALNGPFNTPLPQRLTVSFGAPLQIVQWRMWFPVCSFCAKDVDFEFWTGTAFVPLAEAKIVGEQKCSSCGGTTPQTVVESSVFSAPITTSQVRLVVRSVYDCSQNPSSGFQVGAPECPLSSNPRC